MMRRRKRSERKQMVLEVIGNGDGLGGYDVSRQAKLRGGSVWTILADLEADGLIEGNFESVPGRRARRLYRLRTESK